MASNEQSLPKAEVNKSPNSTDPAVIFDPQYEKTVVTTVWNPEDKTEEGAEDSNMLVTEIDKTKVAGIEYPIIQLNTSLILREHIVNFILSSAGFKPEIYLEILKENYLVGTSPGLVNKLTVILIPPVDGTYKKISLDFYITDMIDDGKKLCINADFLFPAFETIQNKALKRNYTNKLSTYDLLYYIASECKLGFAATDNCKDIDDIRPRLAFAENYEQIIEKHMKFSGKDEDSIFITWIDFYGYLVLCNLSWVLNKSVDFNDLAIKQLEGINITETSAFPNNAIKFGKDTFRILTNQEILNKKEANIVKTYDWEIDNSMVKQHGTNNTYFVFNPVANTGINCINSKNIEITENTIDGKLRKDVYNFEKKSFIGIELALSSDNNTPILMQERVRDAFLVKSFRKKLKVVMREPHLGLQRGTLINLLIYNYDGAGKAKLLNNTTNLTNDEEDEIAYDEEFLDSEETQEYTTNEQLGVIDMSISGMYFIEGITLSFNNRTGLTQTLSLIRKDPDMNYSNFSQMINTGLSKTLDKHQQ